MKKSAPVDHPIHPLLSERWSPYAWTAQSVSVEELHSLFEAARWAASSYNEQPWRFIVARREEPEAFAKVLSCLVEGNQKWAGTVSVLALGLVDTLRAQEETPNRAAEHDLGLAVANLSAEATHRGIAVHQMIGIVPERVREVYALPERIQPLTAFALGYAAEAADAPTDLADRHARPRVRHPLADFVFGENWGVPAPFLGTK